MLPLWLNRACCALLPPQAFSVIGIALIALGEEIGAILFVSVLLRVLLALVLLLCEKPGADP